MIGNRFVIATIVVFLAVGPLNANAWWFWGSSDDDDTTEAATTEATTTAATTTEATTIAATTTEATTTAATTTATTTTEATTIAAPVIISSSECPSDSETYFSYSDKSNCSQYYVCDSGRAIQMSCPAGLEYNSELQVCDWPANAGCSISSEE